MGELYEITCTSAFAENCVVAGTTKWQSCLVVATSGVLCALTSSLL
jgi:hypothetical protein